MKFIFSDRSVGLAVKKELYDGVVVPAVTYGVQTCGLWMEKRHKLERDQDGTKKEIRT